METTEKEPPLGLLFLHRFDEPDKLNAHGISNTNSAIQNHHLPLKIWLMVTHAATLSSGAAPIRRCERNFWRAW
jgi:hypothetical protein